MHYIVTGGCGFIGGHLVERLAEQGYQVTVVDDQRNGKFVTHQSNVDYIFEDVCDFTPPPCDGIIHLANTPRVRLSFEQPVDAILNNIAPTVHVAEWAAMYDCPLYFAQSSSALFSEPYANPYTFGKAMSEESLHFYQKHWGIKFHMLYFYNVYGPREISAGKYATLIALFNNKLRKDEPLTIVKPGLQKRNFTHIDDIIDGLILIGAKGKGDEFGIGHHKEYSVLEIANLFKLELS